MVSKSATMYSETVLLCSMFSILIIVINIIIIMIVIIYVLA